MQGTTRRRLQVKQLEERETPATLLSGFHETLLATGLSGPTAMEQAPDGRIFVTEQGGAVRVISNGELLAAPFLTLNVDSSGERGLLGITFDPNFNTNHYVYLYYTTATGQIHNRVSRFTANGNQVIAGSETVLIDLDPLSAATNHNGGALHFGTDGKLYIAVGENGNPANSQTLGNKLGKILRINADGTIPGDNPFVGVSGAQPAIWALGLRNPFTFAVQPGTGRIFINDVGLSSFEEINDGAAGANYGWPNAEGPGGAPTYVDPFFSYTHGSSTTQGNAITGGTFYNPTTNQFGADYAGDYFFADLTSGWIRRIDPSTKAVSLFATNLPVPVDLDVDAGGNLYYLVRGTGGSTGAVYRIDHGVVTPEQKFVGALYQDLIGRTGGTAELDAWAQLLPTVGRAGVVVGIQRSAEGFGHLVDGFYSHFLGRPADSAGRTAWVGLLQRGGTAEQVMAGILSSAEFATRANQIGGTANADENYVRALYSLVLGRTGDQTSIDAWEGYLGTVGRSGVAQGFLASSEFRTNTVRTLYGQPTGTPPAFIPNLLNRTASPSDSEVQAWVNSGADYLTLVLGFAGSGEYFVNG